RMLRPVGEAFEGTGKCGGVRPDKFQLPGALYRMGSDRYREIEPASIHLSTRLSENDKRTFIWTEFQGNGCTVAVILKLWQVPNRTLYTIPPFGLFTGDPEGRLNGNVLITLVGDEIDITVFQFPVEEYHRIRFFRTHIGLHSYPREGFLQTNPVKYHPFAVLVFSNGFSVDMAPELPRQFLHLLIGLLIIGKAGRTQWFGTKDHPSLLPQLLDFPEQCRTHGFQLWKNEDLIRKTVGQSETAVFQRQSVEDDLGIDIVKGIPFRQGWILHPGQFRGVLTNEIGDIRYVTPLLQHEVAALKVGDKAIHVIVPGVEPVKFVA